jgi:uncharacterized membrane protein
MKKHLKPKELLNDGVFQLAALLVVAQSLIAVLYDIPIGGFKFFGVVPVHWALEIPAIFLLGFTLPKIFDHKRIALYYAAVTAFLAVIFGLPPTLFFMGFALSGTLEGWAFNV